MRLIEVWLLGVIIFLVVCLWIFDHELRKEKDKYCELQVEHMNLQDKHIRLLKEKDPKITNTGAMSTNVMASFEVDTLFVTHSVMAFDYSEIRFRIEADSLGRFDFNTMEIHGDTLYTVKELLKTIELIRER